MGRNRRLADVPMPPADQQLLTRLEACKVGRIGTSTFDKAVANEDITVRWNGSRIIVEREEVLRFIKTLPTKRNDQKDRPKKDQKKTGSKNSAASSTH